MRRVVALLEGGLGREVSEQKVASAMLQLGLCASGPEQAQLVLQALSREPGIVGVTARFALLRAQLAAREPTLGLPDAPSPSSSAPGVPPPSAPVSRPGPPASPSPESVCPPSGRPITLEHIASLLAHTLGAERSLEVVQEAARAMSLSAGHVTVGEASAILESLASRGSLLGIAARFAKSRILLKRSG